MLSEVEMLKVTEKLMKSLPGLASTLKVALELGDEVSYLAYNLKMRKEQLASAEARLKE